ncbi:phosphatase PAP2 family protein [Francisella halioticida]|uniref:phosphatase PAP2 family protein n=1 Tax=Francisella halioticida TaxID=549298 RepID=UPI001BB38647
MLFISFIPLIAIFIARVVLGAHWPSDLIITYMVGVVWIMFLISFIKRTQN